MSHHQQAHHHVRRSPFALQLLTCAVVLGAWAGASALTVFTQGNDVAADEPPPLDRSAPALNARLIALERAQGVLVGALLDGKGTVDEADVLRRMRSRLTDVTSSGRPDPEAERGFAALGSAGAETINRAHAFHRTLVAIMAGVPAARRTHAIDAAIQRYRNRSAIALPDAPKDMTILYDHPYTSFIPPAPPETEPRRVLRYPSLTGFMWAAHWYELAVLEPLQDATTPAERNRGLALVADRFARKLSGGTPPDGFPTELPLAPAIAPGLVALHERSAAIVDNLNILLDVLTDVLVHPGVPDRRAAINQIVAEFLERQYRCVQSDEWVLVALRHSIFDQGGFALAPMNGYERNASFGGHGQHYAIKRTPPACDPE